MIKAMKLRNFRSLRQSDWIRLAPITVLLGRNSSGKSSFLRLLPLLKQSMLEETKEPLLWYGRLVDFGSFSDVLSIGASEPEFSIEFKAELSQDAQREVAFTESGEQLFIVMPGANRHVFADKVVQVAAGLSLRKRSVGDGAYVSSVSLEMFDSRLVLSAGEDGVVVSVKINDRPLQVTESIRLVNLKGRFFPVISLTKSEDVRSTVRHPFEAGEGPFFSAFIAALDPLFHGNTSSSKRREHARDLKFGPIGQFYDGLTKSVAHARRVAPWSGKAGAVPALVETAWRYAFARYAPNIFRQVNAELAKFAASVRYLAPVRASASRYYRFQELAVDEIDPQGDNVPMFINSLSDSEKASLEGWMEKNLGFKVTATRSGGHTALFVHETGGMRELNLADTGFGYSQILPVVLQIWRSISRTASDRRGQDRSDKFSTIAIEQPELHLHPQFQAVLADVFAATLSGENGQKSVNYVVETHSEHLVNRLGALVESGALDPDIVSIVLFDKQSSSEPALVRQACFGPDGVVKGDWPFGFFVPEF